KVLRSWSASRAAEPVVPVAVSVTGAVSPPASMGPSICGAAKRFWDRLTGTMGPGPTVWARVAPSAAELGEFPLVETLAVKPASLKAVPSSHPGPKLELLLSGACQELVQGSDPPDRKPSLRSWNDSGSMPAPAAPSGGFWNEFRCFIALPPAGPICAQAGAPRDRRAPLMR